MQAHLRLRRITQTIADLSGKPWHELRVLDLGSLEGLFAMEFASRGAKVVAIEGRAVNHEKARFAAEQKGLRDIEFVTEDVRNFSKERFGVFDVVVCSGLLYHLPGTDACRFRARNC
jgi:2-polyprenyl-3-methyl-5-hydroxy-6-metoxy-1,4-benzoquinol methylase